MALWDDLPGIDPDEAENLGKNELLPEGFYVCKLDGAKQDESKNKGTPFIGLTFIVQDAKHHGKILKEELWLTDKERMKLRQVLFGLRLGCLERVKGDDGKDKVQPVKNKEDFQACIGTNVVLHVEVDKNDKDDGSGKQYQPKNRVAFGGIYKVGDPEVYKLMEALEKRKAGKPDKPAASGPIAATEESGKYDEL